ncbi:hypothetical protein [Microbacterium sp.]|uniref:hypothetical protein n=1 Tax=Microbacterium sp. TaxID=51671 RepID=UPI0025CDF0DC|nr:hypothetical protein [Microbacterium sp.]
MSVPTVGSADQVQLIDLEGRPPGNPSKDEESGTATGTHPAVAISDRKAAVAMF